MRKKYFSNIVIMVILIRIFSPNTLMEDSAFPMLDDAKQVYTPNSFACTPFILNSVVVFHSSSGFTFSIISYLFLCNQELIDEN